MDFSAKIFVAKATQGNIVKRIMVNYQHGDQNGINGNGGSTHLVPLMPPLASSEGGDVPPQPPQQLFGAAATALHYQQQQQQNCDEPMPTGTHQQHQNANNGLLPASAVFRHHGNANICRGCGKEILDRHLLCLHRPPRHNNNDPISDPGDGGGAEFWHEHCLRCWRCERSLTSAEGSCFVRDGRPFCRAHYAELFGLPKLCSRCAIPLSPSDLVFRSAAGHVFHTRCFCCSCCGTQLAPGDRYVLAEGGKLICERDLNLATQLHSQVQMPSTPHQAPEDAQPLLDSSHFLRIPPFPELDFSALQRPNFHHHHHHNDRSKKIPKRPRTILNAPQRKAFKLAFEKGPKPSRKVREQLARETGLSVRVVQVWFQNQRAKMKKECKREMDKQQSNAGCSGGGSVSSSTDSERKEEDGEGPNMARSPQSGSPKSDTMMADDELFDGAYEEPDEDATTVDGYPGGEGGGCSGMDQAQEQGQQSANPIEKIHNMYQTYFAFV